MNTLATAGLIAFFGGAVLFFGYTVGRLHEMRRHQVFLATVIAQERLVLERMKEERRLQLEGENRHGLLTRE